MQRIYFHHIGKTAGTSLRNLLIDRLGEAQVAPMLRTGKLRDALNEYDRFAAITGHLHALPGDRLPPDRVSITLIRDPVDRVLSEFFFSKNVNMTGRHHPASTTTDVFDWLASLDDAEARERLNAHLAALWPLGWSEHSIPSVAERTEAAKRALDGFDIVGLQRSMADTLATVCFRLGWEAPASVPYDNRTPGRLSVADLPASVARRLDALLGPDREIHEHAIALFERQRLAVLRAATRLNAGSPVRARDAHDAPSEGERESAQKGVASPTNGDTGNAKELGTREIRIDGVSVSGEISGPDNLQVGERTTVTVRFESMVHEDDLTIGFSIRDARDGLVFGTNTRLLGEAIQLSPGSYAVQFRFPNELGIGRYSVTATAHKGDSHLEGCYHIAERAGHFEVLDVLAGQFEGRVRLHVTAHVERSGTSGSVSVRPVATGESDTFAHLGRRNPKLTDFSAEIRPLAPLAAIPRATQALIKLAIRNTGRQKWGVFGKRAVAVSYHWVNWRGKHIVHDGLRTSLPHDLEPGAMIEVPCFVQAPEQVGSLRLVWTLVQEDVAWFNDRNRRSCYECKVQIS